MSVTIPQETTTSVRIGGKLGESFERLQERIRECAYQIFLDRDPAASDPISDWLQAQMQVLTPVDMVVKEQKKNIIVEAGLKGFTPKEIEVEVGSDDLKLFGSHTDTNSAGGGNNARSSTATVHFYQSVSLPCAVEAADCKATLLKNGKLKITLPKKIKSN